MPDYAYFILGILTGAILTVVIAALRGLKK